MRPSRFAAAAALLLLAFESAYAAAPAFVSQLGNYSTNLTPSMSFTSGNTLVLFINTLRSSAAARTVSSVSSTNTTGWTRLGNIANGSMGVEVWYGHATATAGEAITITMSGAVVNQAINILQFSGVLTTGTINDGSAVTNSGTSTSPSSNAYTSTVVGDLILTCEGHANGTAPSAVPGGNYSNATFAASGSTIGIQSEYWTNAGTGAKIGTWTITSAAWGTVIGGLKPISTPNTGTASNTTLSAETVSIAKGYQRTAADATLSTETVTRSEGSSRSAANTTLSAEVVALGHGVLRTAASTTLSSETPAIARGYTRAASDPGLSNETTAIARGYSRSPAGVLALNAETVASYRGVFRTSAASTLGAVALGRSIAAYRAVGDTTLSNETVARSLGLRASVAVASVGSVNLTRSTGLQRTSAANAAIGESNTATPSLAGGVNIPESVVISESATVSLVLYRGASDGIPLLAIESRSAGMRRVDNAAAVPFGATSSRQVAASRTLAGISVHITDLLDRSGAFSRYASDAAAAAPITTRSVAATRSAGVNASVAADGMFGSTGLLYSADLDLILPISSAIAATVAVWNPYVSPSHAWALRRRSRAWIQIIRTRDGIYIRKPLEFVVRPHP